MKRGEPPLIKIYEALGCIADDRISLESSDQGLFGDLNPVTKAKVTSSSGGKSYDVEYDESKNAIMANDSASYRQGYVSYPSIALLLKIGKLPLNEVFANNLKDIKRKDINTKNKGAEGKAKTIEQIDDGMVAQGVDLDQFHAYVQQLLAALVLLDLSLLGAKKMPPKGY